MSISVEVITERCHGYANCLSAAPGLFELSDDVAVASASTFGEEHRAALEAAARRCPTHAIVLRAVT